MKVLLAPLAPFSQNVLREPFPLPPSGKLGLAGSSALTLLAPADQTMGEAQPDASKL